MSTVVDAPVCMFHMDYIIWEYLFYIWVGLFESRHFTFYRYIFMSVRQVYMKFRAQVYRDRDGRKHILFPFIILQKRHVLLLWVHTNKRRVFTDSKDVLLLWAKMRQYFKGKWAHRRLHLSCSELLFSFHTPHRHLNSTHFFRLTLDWAAV